MDISQPRLISIGLLFVFIFLSGFWLTHLGKPYAVVLFNIHKFIALAAVVLFVVTMIQMNRAIPLGPTELLAAIVTGLLFAGTIITGGLVNIEKALPAIVLTLHRIMPFLTALSTAATLYLLSQR